MKVVKLPVDFWGCPLLLGYGENLLSPSVAHGMAELKCLDYLIFVRLKRMSICLSYLLSPFSHFHALTQLPNSFISALTNSPTHLQKHTKTHTSTQTSGG